MNIGKLAPSLGKVIAAERARQNLTLDELARTSGVSKGMLSQIEQGKTNPTVAVLYRIAAGLHVEPSRLLPVSPTMPRVWRVMRADDQRHEVSGDGSCRIRPLSPLDLEKQLELYEISFEPEGSLVSEAHYHGTDEILTVTQGSIRVRSGEQDIEIKKGDSLHYAADVPHSLTNTGKSKALGFLLVWYRS